MPVFRWYENRFPALNPPTSSPGGGRGPRAMKLLLLSLSTKLLQQPVLVAARRQRQDGEHPPGLHSPLCANLCPPQAVPHGWSCFPSRWPQGLHFPAYRAEHKGHTDLTAWRIACWALSCSSSALGFIKTFFPA